jgi:predicted alpha/beta hydrolase family esterase
MSVSILLVADAPTTEPDDWMRRWAGALPDASMLLLGSSSLSDPAQWPDAVAREVAGAHGRTIIVARGRACGAVRDAARRLRPGIAGAMFVAPSSVGDASRATSSPGFPIVVVTSRSASGPETLRILAEARAQGSRCVDGGEIGSAGEDAGLGDWSHGRHVLNWLIALVSDDVALPTSTACQGNVVDFRAPRSAARIAG